MITEKTMKQFKVAQEIARRLYDIKIINPRFADKGGNVLISPENNTTAHYEMYNVTPSLRARPGGRLNEMRETRYFLNKYNWLMRGERTLAYRQGNSRDCAAAAAYLLLSILPKELMRIKVELVTGNDYTFVVVNRTGIFSDLTSWGENSFFIDIWYQNQFLKNTVKGVYFTAGLDTMFNDYYMFNAGPNFIIEATLRGTSDCHDG